MTDRALYDDLARFYDRVYHWKDYDDDIERLKGMLAASGGKGQGALLDIGCGTGEHLTRLVADYGCTGIDISGPMLELARSKVPRAEFILTDMLGFHLDREFDVVISMFGTIGYALTLEELETVARNIEAHLAFGGVAVLEPFISREDFIPGHVAMNTYEDDDVKISRVSTGRLEGDICTFEMHYLIGERGKGVRYVLDTHTTRLHTPEELVCAMEGAGLSAEFDPVGFGQRRGVLIATKGP
jgi:SAM-dependent methyltransferase